MNQSPHAHLDKYSVFILTETRRSCVQTHTPYLIVDGCILNQMFFVTSYTVNSKYVVYTNRVHANYATKRERLCETTVRCFVCTEFDVFLSSRSRETLRMSQRLSVPYTTLRYHIMSYATFLPTSICFLLFHLEQKRFMSIFVKSNPSVVFLPLYYQAKYVGGLSDCI
jgi:hypothetical protein